jgi:acetylornithine deacetylase/succinyl-diaminopimelate desuccinylase family protein
MKMADHCPNILVPESDLVLFLQQLVRIPSVNPPGNEEEVARVVAAKLLSLGFEVTLHESAPRRVNVVGRLPGSGGGPTLILNGHTDVQPPASGWLHDPFGAEIENGYLYGRGAMDMKAGIAAMIYGVEAVLHGGTRRRGDIVFTAVADEVSGGHHGTGYLLENNLIAGDIAIVGEPTGEQIYIAHRGVIWMEIEVFGKSAHSGRPWLGVNAISKAGKIIHAIETELAPLAAKKTHDLVPAPTYNLGGITGGTKFNLVADRAVIELERRMIPGEVAADCVAEVRALCERISVADQEPWYCSVREVMHVDGAEVDRNGRAVRACQQAYREETGEDAKLGATSGFEDAHFFLKAGIDTAMFGPYRRQSTEGGGQFFTVSGMADECVAIADVVTAARVYARLITNLIC